MHCISRVVVGLMIVGLGATLATPVEAARAQPRIAVYRFNSTGVTAWWGANIDPGEALAELLSDRLVRAGTYTVLDRDHIDQVLREQNLARSGDVTPASEVKLGRMLGVSYLFVGRIIEFAKTDQHGGGLGGIIPRALGGAGVASTKTVLRVSLKVIEASSGRIVASVDDEQNATATSFSVAGAGFGPGAAGGGRYTSSEFESSAMGKLLTAVADDLVTKVGKLEGAAPAATISGRVLSTEGGSIIMNVGSDKGVAEGMIFDVFDVKTLLDPDSHKSITTEIQRGTIQVISVSADSAVAKRISGTVRALAHARSE